MKLVVGSKLIVLYFGQRDEALTKKMTHRGVTKIIAFYFKMKL